MDEIKTSKFQGYLAGHVFQLLLIFGSSYFIWLSTEWLKDREHREEKKRIAEEKVKLG